MRDVYGGAGLMDEMCYGRNALLCALFCMLRDTLKFMFAIIKHKTLARTLYILPTCRYSFAIISHFLWELRRF